MTLRINKETLRNLSAEEQSQVAGAMPVDTETLTNRSLRFCRTNTPLCNWLTEGCPSAHNHTCPTGTQA